MNSRLSSLVGLTVGLVATACASIGPTVDGDRDGGPFNGATIDISAEGGFAVQAVTHHVDHDTRAFAFSQRQLCGTTCGAPSDSAVGTLTASTADSVFTVVLEQARSLRKDDYGITRNGADMMTYTIRLVSSGRVRTIRGDDGSLPEAARTLVATVYTAISTARGR